MNKNIRYFYRFDLLGIKKEINFRNFQISSSKDQSIITDSYLETIESVETNLDDLEKDVKWFLQLIEIFYLKKISYFHISRIIHKKKVESL